MTKSQLASKPARFLAEAQREERWFSLAALLQSAMAEPARFGFTGADEILAKVAEARRQHPGALRGPLAARRYIVENFPEAGSQDGFHCGYSAVQVLAAIHEISGSRARELLPDVLSGKLTTRPLRQIYREMSENRPTAGAGKAGVAASTKRRSVAFGRAVDEFVRANIHLFCSNAAARLSEKARIGPLAPEHLIIVDDVPKVAIETRIPGASVYRKQINEAVELCALTLLRVPEVWVIAPLSALKHMERMASVAQSFELQGAHFACLDEKLAEDDPMRALKEA